MKKDQSNSRQVHNDYYKRGCQMIVAMALVMILILVAVTYTWYTLLQNRMANSEERDVMTPYYLYLVDKNGTDSLKLSVGNLHPGETKQIMIGVTNQKPNNEGGVSYQIGKNSSFHYDLELAYTSNLPLNFTVYALTENDEASGESAYTATWTDKDSHSVTKKFQKSLLNRNDGTSTTLTEKNNKEMYGEDKVDQTVNTATYDVYDKNGEADFQLKTTVGEDGKVSFDLNYYLIELSWQNDISFPDYLKETDLMYVMVNAMQLEPQESAGPAGSTGESGSAEGTDLANSP